MDVRYRAPAGPAAAELRDRASRFFAVVAFAPSLEAARAVVEEHARRYPDATHVCSAWRVGWPPVERAADAGEPAGTAGAPILSALAGAGLSDVCAAVARYFGGTKLGRGGLVRAYGGVVRLALAELPTHAVFARVRLLVRLPYERLGAVKRLLVAPAVELAAERYGEAVELELDVAEEARPAFDAALADLGLAAHAV